MKPLIKGLALNYPVKVFATGFVVLTLLSISLFWFRYICQMSLSVKMPGDAKDIRIEPSGLVPPELENDPNVVSHSRVFASMQPEEKGPLSLGIFDYFITRFPGGRRSPGGHRSNVYFFESDRDCMYFDKKSGQIVHLYTKKQTMLDITTSLKMIQLYVGPEGVSETQDKTLGRFIGPIIDHGWLERRWIDLREGGLSELILYDKKLRCFFKIDFNQRTVVKGPKLGKNDRRHEPIQIGLLDKTAFELSYLNWTPPRIRIPDEDPNKTGYSTAKLKPIIPTDYDCDAGPYLLVLDETGRIDLLDKETLEFVKRTPEFPGVAGRLPGPETYFGPKDSVTPRELLDYKVWPLALTTCFFENPEEVRVTFGDPSYFFKRAPARVERKYLGMFAASLSRDGTALALAVFDEKGKRIKESNTRLTKYEGGHTTQVQSSKAFFFGAPWSPTLTIGKYLTENLHPPILSVASYFTASAFEAASGHRALFFLPNSFIAIKAGDRGENIAERFMSALCWILPSIILAIWLACRVSKDAVVVGLSENARAYWIIGTLAFGLTAYITYRLTRPKITLVTCPNCGKMRRPDMVKCHRCKSDWHVPELIPPVWRVLKGTEKVHEGSTADAEEAVVE